MLVRETRAGGEQPRRRALAGFPSPDSDQSHAHRLQMVRSLEAMFASGALLALISSAMPHTPDVNEVGTAVTAALGLPAALLLHLTGGWLPRWAFHAFLAIGTLIISLGVYFGGGGPNGTAGATFYVWVSLYAFYFFPWSISSAHIGFVGAAYATVLAIQHDRAGAAEWVLVVGTAGVAGLVVGSLARQVRALARVDSLTGLPNRRAWEEALPQEMDRARRDQRPFCMVILDLDHFKILNDESGHQAGDLLLQQAASAWSRQLRASDTLARMGGDEFVLVLPSCGSAKAEEIVDRLRRATPKGRTCSAGIACWDGSESVEDLIRRADAALYEAKRGGRNRTVMAELAPIQGTVA